MTIDYSRAYPALTDFFVRQIARDTCAHAYLLLGPRGIGKASLAEGFSRALVDSAFAPSASQYFRTDASQLWTAHIHPDVVFVRPDEGGHIGIDAMRHFQRTMHERPMFGIRRVGVLVHAERLTYEAMSSILKLLEEPPRKVVLILLGESESAFPQTILSRCQILRIPRLPDASLQSLLSIPDTPESQMCLELAHGRVRFAAALLLSPELREQHVQVMNQAIALLEEGRATRELRSRMVDEKEVSALFDALELLCIDMLTGHLAGTGSIRSAALRAAFLSLSRRLSLHKIVIVSRFLSRGRQFLAANVSPQGVFEQMLATL